ncbi:MAG: hypothetical protein AABX66_00120 [Nanoarchaeota archaeon]
MKTNPLVVLLRNILTPYIGGSSIGLVEVLYDKKNVNEFLISKKLKLTINQTRNVLYKLSDEGLVSFVRKKDNKKGGWYTYFWTLNIGRCLEKYRESLIEGLRSLREQRDSKKNSRFYKCINCNIEFNEEQALNANYTCSECGEVLQVKDMMEIVAGLDKEITKLEVILVKVSAELEVIREEETKANLRKVKTNERKKKQERDAKRKSNARAKAKSKGKAIKLSKKKGKK